MKNYIIEEDFIYNNYRCVIIFQSGGFRCGYVGVTSTNLLYGMDLDDINTSIVNGAIPADNFSIHGGVTFADGGNASNYPIESDLWWFGFDCAHFNDGRDYDLACEKFPQLQTHIRYLQLIEENISNYKDLDFVKKECIKLVNQLKIYERKTTNSNERVYIYD